MPPLKKSVFQFKSCSAQVGEFSLKVCQNLAQVGGLACLLEWYAWLALQAHDKNALS